jgi:anthranilate phosphoribosyltransferase
LAIRSIFNILGPLTNPAGANHQLLGVAMSSKRETVAKVLGALGSTRAWVVTGEGGLDEVSPAGPTDVTEWHRGQMREFTIDPESAGLARVPLGAIKGGDPAYNAKVFVDLLDGVPGPVQTAVAINAAAALVVAERANDLKTGAQMALDAMASRAAKRTFARWKAIMEGAP